MKERVLLLLTGYLMLIVGCSSNVVKENDMKRQEEKSLKTNYEQQVSINYLLYLPKDYNGKDKFPLMMFLHGSGERGNNLELELILKI
jgi:predicted peptidase